MIKRKIGITVLLLIAMLSIVHAATDRYNYVYNGTDWIPWISTPDGKPKIDLNLVNITTNGITLNGSTILDWDEVNITYSAGAGGVNFWEINGAVLQINTTSTGGVTNIDLEGNMLTNVGNLVVDFINLNGNMTPSTDGLYSIGNYTHWIKKLWVEQIQADNINTTNLTASYIVSQSLVSTNISADNLTALEGNIANLTADVITIGEIIITNISEDFVVILI